MKNFYLNQKVWCVRPDDTHIQSSFIYSISQEYIEIQVADIFRYYTSLDDFKRIYTEKFDILNKSKVKYYAFYNEVDAIRYAKAQMIHKLQRLEKNAKAAVEELVKYRNENFELLNCK